MVNRISLIPLIALLVVLGLQNCKVDPKINIAPVESDSLYIGTKYTIQKPFKFPNINNPYKDSLTYEGVELGRRLFYDKHLSSTGQVACANCHKQEYAFSDGGNALSTNVFGITRRNAPALQNLLWLNRYFWDGRVMTLAAQAKDAFHGEQGLNIPDAISYLESDSNYVKLFKKAFGRPGAITEDKIYLAVQQFVMTLISSESHFDKAIRGQEQFTQSELNGLDIFRTELGDCFHCHTQGDDYLFTNASAVLDNGFTNNGLDSVHSVYEFADKGLGEVTGDTTQFGRFKNPSFRNLSLTGPYMHDGRYQTLEQVLNFYSDSVRRSSSISAIMFFAHSDGKRHFTDEQKQDLLALINSLTDYSFISDTSKSNPFK